MDRGEEEFLQRLRETFKIEAEEHLSNISAELNTLETADNGHDPTSSLETMYREAHSLKGAARAVNLREVETVCQALESVFALLKKKELSFSRRIFDSAYNSIDVMAQLIESDSSVQPNNVIQELASIQSEVDQARGRPVAGAGRKDRLDNSNSAGRYSGIIETSEQTTVAEHPVSDQGIIAEPNKGDTGEGISIEISGAQEAGNDLASASNAFPDSDAGNVYKTPKTNELSSQGFDKHKSSHTVRIATNKLDRILFQAEEMVSCKLAIKQRSQELAGIQSFFEAWNKKWASVSRGLRAAEALSDPLNRTLSIEKEKSSLPIIQKFLEWNASEVKILESRFRNVSKAVQNDSRTLQGMIDDLIYDVKNALTLPFSTLLDIFPRMVRDLAGQRSKQIRLETFGGQIEIDRRILDEMKDPLIHLVRNSVDHGIETQQDRIKRNKTPYGILTVGISHVTANRVEIIVCDDGAGIDADRVKKTAVQKRLISDQESRDLSDQDAVSLIFRSGMSTSPIITDISGRGLGLAIVIEKADKLGGTVSVQSSPGHGVQFRIELPVTLATFRGTLVEASGRLFVISTSNVERVLRVRSSSVVSAAGRATIPVGGRPLGLAVLSRLLEIQDTENSGKQIEYLSVVVLSARGRKIGLLVDRILNEQEVIVKSLGKQLSRVKNVSGATVLASGDVVPILNPSDLIKSSQILSGKSLDRTSRISDKSRNKKTILVAEDSITSRMLLKNILETAGYDVSVSVDGSDAWQTLKTKKIDLLVSDVEMPRMTGFDLTIKIRADKKLSETPVILVTSLESREDRERGIDAGANAYIVKSSFDQSNLLAAVRSLI
jgi:two-component system, chemotaxis family, sensor kinase CheA